MTSTAPARRFDANRPLSRRSAETDVLYDVAMLDSVSPCCTLWYTFRRLFAARKLLCALLVRDLDACSVCPPPLAGK